MIIERSTTCPHCGSGHSNSCYIVYDDGYKCFSCGASNKKHSNEYLYKTTNKDNVKNHLKNNSHIPEFTTNIKEFSLQTLNFLYSFFTFDNLIKKYQIAYCPLYDKLPESLLYPVFCQEDFAYQRRFFPKDFYSSANLNQIIFSPGVENSNTIFIVEDYISAIRIAEYSKSLCLFTTKLSKNKVNFVVNNCYNVVIWLDADAAGASSTRANAQMLQKQCEYNFKYYPHLFTQDIKIDEFYHNKSPKECTNAELKEIISNYTSHID